MYQNQFNFKEIIDLKTILTVLGTVFGAYFGAKIAGQYAVKSVEKQIDFQKELGESSVIKTNSNKKNKKDKNEGEKADLPLSLSDKTILVIGNEPKKVLYQSSIEERGGTFLWADAKDNFTHLESVVRKSDMVFFLLKVSGHTGMKQIKAYCKRYKKPFLTTFSNGRSSMMKTAEETLIG